MSADGLTTQEALNEVWRILVAHPELSVIGNCDIDHMREGRFAVIQIHLDALIVGNAIGLNATEGDPPLIGGKP